MTSHVSRQNANFNWIEYENSIDSMCQYRKPMPLQQISRMIKYKLNMQNQKIDALYKRFLVGNADVLN